MKRFINRILESEMFKHYCVNVMRIYNYGHVSMYR